MSAPIAVCRTSELAETGAFWTHDVARAPVLVVRDAQGTIRAFVNLCRHRGVRLVQAQHGVTKSFTCLLHGWTYDTTGQMGGGPLARLARDNPMLAAIRENNALTPLPSELRHGFVWVAPVAHAPVDIAAFLGSMDADLAALAVETFELRTRDSSPLETHDGALMAAVSPLLGASDVLRVVSEDMLVVLHPTDISIFTRSRRRPESDFGESSEADEEVVERGASIPPPQFESEEQCSLEHMLLGPPRGA